MVEFHLNHMQTDSIAPLQLQRTGKMETP